MKKKGFTLIELLVVISIIALLLSILMPALSKVKEQGRNVVCQSSLKQFGLANALYANENRDNMAHPTFFLYTQDSYAKWDDEVPFGCRWHDDRIPADGPIWPYLDSKNITRCPTFASVSVTEGCENVVHDGQVKPQSGYVMNAYIMLPETAKDPWPAQSFPKNWVTWKLSNIPNPSKVAIFCEENTFTIPGLSSKALFNTYFMPLPPNMGLGAAIATFHRESDIRKGTSNISFADGHVGHEDGTVPESSYELTGSKYLNKW